MIIYRIEEDERIQYPEQAAEENIEAVCGFPVMVAKRIVGALRFYFQFEFEPDEDDQTYMALLADQIGIALEKDQIVINLQSVNNVRQKTYDLEALLKDKPVKILNLSDFGPMPGPVEDRETFEDNAYLKAIFYARVLGLPALADDSGLMVEALNGAPGVHSARWAGESATDAEKCNLLLKRMEGQINRQASFFCALVLAVPSGPALTWVGRCDGRLTDAPRGFNGFGYDPIFFYPPLERTFAELTRAEKGRVSHRGQALNEFKSEFDKILIWLDQRMNEVRSPV